MINRKELILTCPQTTGISRIGFEIILTLRAFSHWMKYFKCFYFLLFPPLETYMHFAELVEGLVILVPLVGFPLKHFSFKRIICGILNNSVFCQITYKVRFIITDHCFHSWSFSILWSLLTHLFYFYMFSLLCLNLSFV